jgi:hypothetical protein
MRSTGPGAQATRPASARSARRRLAGAFNRSRRAPHRSNRENVNKLRGRGARLPIAPPAPPETSTRRSGLPAAGDRGALGNSILAEWEGNWGSCRRSRRTGLRTPRPGSRARARQTGQVWGEATTSFLQSCDGFARGRARRLESATASREVGGYQRNPAISGNSPRAARTDPGTLG